MLFKQGIRLLSVGDEILRSQVHMVDKLVEPLVGSLQIEFIFVDPGGALQQVGV